MLDKGSNDGGTGPTNEDEEEDYADDEFQPATPLKDNGEKGRRSADLPVSIVSSQKEMPVGEEKVKKSNILDPDSEAPDSDDDEENENEEEYANDQDGFDEV